MFAREKQIIVSLIGSILILTFYSLHIYENFISGNPDILNSLQFWGESFIILIPIAIIVQIIIHIIFAIINKILTNEDPPKKNDERDKLIELKAIRISHWIFTAGFFIAMGTLAVNMPPYIMFLLLISSGFLASIFSDIAKIYYYRRGF